VGKIDFLDGEGRQKPWQIVRRVMARDNNAQRYVALRLGFSPIADR
jgi:hypothetical protein